MRTVIAAGLVRTRSGGTTRTLVDVRPPPKPQPGDRVAVLSPSSGLPGLLPLPYELGLRRLASDAVLGLTPVEYPTTRRMHATPSDRAEDLHAAFTDPTIAAVIATIGGDDQLRLCPAGEITVWY